MTGYRTLARSALQKCVLSGRNYMIFVPACIYFISSRTITKNTFLFVFSTWLTCFKCFYVTDMMVIKLLTKLFPIQLTFQSDIFLLQIVAIWSVREVAYVKHFLYNMDRIVQKKALTCNFLLTFRRDIALSKLLNPLKNNLLALVFKLVWGSGDINLWYKFNKNCTRESANKSDPNWSVQTSGNFWFRASQAYVSINGTNNYQRILTRR